MFNSGMTYTRFLLRVFFNVFMLPMGGPRGNMFMSICSRSIYVQKMSSQFLDSSKSILDDHPIM